MPNASGKRLARSCRRKCCRQPVETPGKKGGEKVSSETLRGKVGATHVVAPHVAARGRELRSVASEGVGAPACDEKGMQGELGFVGKVR